MSSQGQRPPCKRVFCCVERTLQSLRPRKVCKVFFGLFVFMNSKSVRVCLKMKKVITVRGDQSGIIDPGNSAAFDAATLHGGEQGMRLRPPQTTKGFCGALFSFHHLIAFGSGSKIKSSDRRNRHRRRRHPGSGVRIRL